MFLFDGNHVKDRLNCVVQITMQ
uniref:Uncharacterized protein n=1 Tax=Arundo donax TaxID=35708 RepID=A0A0A9AUB1_ARUDO